MEVQEGVDICILMTDSHYCTAETNTALLSNYPPINFFKATKCQQKSKYRGHYFDINAIK